MSSDDSFDYIGKTCGDCAYLTQHSVIKFHDLTEENSGLCRFNILKDNFAIMLKNEIACPEFMPKEL